MVPALSDSPERRRSYGSDDNDRSELDEREQEGDTATGLAADRSDGKKRWFHSPALDVENKGSAARDHLANERTFLGWLRTSLSMSSLGIAITQLFRLSSRTVSSSPIGREVSTSDLLRRQNDLSTLQIHEALATLQEQLLSQQAVIDSMQLAANSERARYNKLGKPIGGTFIFAGIILMLFGCFRFFIVQSSLARGMFVPARRSVIVSSLLIGSIIVAAFAAILVIHPAH